MCFVDNRTDLSCSIPATVGKQQTRTRRNHGCSSSWTTTWILGVALASFLLNVTLNVSMLFLRLLLLIVRSKRREVVRLLVAFAPHSKRTQKKKQDIQKTFAQRQGTTRKRHSLNRRTEHYSRQRCTKQQKTTHHLNKKQLRYQSKQANRT